MRRATSARLARPSAVRRPRSNRPRPALGEWLEPRTLLATFVVTDAADAGPGTLRQAILDANLLAGADTITFNIPGDDPVRTIRPLSPLPNIIGTTTIDGTTQPNVKIQLDGSLAGAPANGLTIFNDTITTAGQPNQSVVRGLVINRFSQHGIAVGPPIVTPSRAIGPTAVRIEGNFVGTDWTGNVALGNGGAGVYNNANATIIGVTNTPTPAGSRNVISGNAGPGVWVVGNTASTTQAPAIHGNYIGTNAAGSRALGNAREGVLVEGVGSVDIGGTTVATRNVISGNASSGVRIAQGTSGQVTMRNNYVGTDFAGANALPNGWSDLLPWHDGVTVQTGGAVFILANPVSGPTQQTVHNVISGNAGAGVRVESARDVQIIGGYIGTDATGFADVGNGGGGVVVSSPATITTTVNVSRLTGNLISGNDADGVFFGPGSSVALQFGGNFIGTNAAGTAALGNRGNGVTVAGATTIQSIGLQGPTPTPLPGNVINPTGTTRNVISANGGHGIAVLANPLRTGIGVRSIVNNYIGTDYTGNLPLGNGGSGIYANTGGMTIGAPGPASSNGANVISANGANGITIVGAPVPQGPTTQVANQIQNNRIGTAAVSVPAPTNPFDPGTNAGLGNHGHGIAIFHSAGNRIGTGSATGANVIAYNDGNGVLVEGSGTGTPTSPSGINTATLISGNGISANGKLGIDLSPGFEGVTPNDPRDADVGPNGLLNFPTITEAALNATGTSVQIRFMLAAAPSAPYRVEFFASPLPDPSGYGEGRVFLGSAAVSVDSNGTGQGTFTASNLPAGHLYFTATTIASSSSTTSEFSPAVKGAVPVTPPRPQANTTVSDRRVFYKDSAFDQNTAAGATRYLAAVAPDKHALLPGFVGSFQNITSYTKGINGIELMFFNPSLLPLAVSPDDIAVRIGTGGDPSGWAAGPAPAAVEIIPIPGPNRMYALTWADGALRNTWVEVTVKANADTGLAAPDVFYFGNLVGEIGDGDGKTQAMPRISAIDLSGTRAAAGSDATLSSRFDFNRDGRVNALDLSAVRSNYGKSLSVLAIPVPVVGSDAATDPIESVTEQILG